MYLCCEYNVFIFIYFENARLLRKALDKIGEIKGASQNRRFGNSVVKIFIPKASNKYCKIPIMNIDARYTMACHFWFQYHGICCCNFLTFAYMFVCNEYSKFLNI